MFVLPKALTSSKVPPASKEVSNEPIVVSELTDSGSEEGTKFAPLDVPPIKTVSAITVEGRTAKHAKTLEFSGMFLSCLVNKGKKVWKICFLLPNNELLNAAKISAKLIDIAVEMKFKI